MNRTVFSNNRVFAFACATLLLGCTSALAFYLTKTDPVDALARQLTSDNTRERYKAALPARDAMLAVLPTSETKTQVYLLKSLGDVGEEHLETIAAIRKMCKHSDVRIREAALDALEDVLD